MRNHIEASLDDFINRYIEAHKEQGLPLQIEWDETWPSACEEGRADEHNLINWRPVRRQGGADFSATEHALDMSFHGDIKAFYSRYWSDGLDANTERGALQLLQAWNQDDFDRLLQNLVGHVLMKRRLKQPVTLFFAVTDHDDFIISLDNATGKVMLEQVGLEPKEVLADCLADFLQHIEPGTRVQPD